MFAIPYASSSSLSYKALVRYCLPLLIFLMSGAIPAWAAEAAQKSPEKPQEILVVNAEPATLSFFNRDIYVMRATAFGFPPEERARVAAERIRLALDVPGEAQINLLQEPGAYRVEMNGRWVFSVIQQDLNPLTEEKLDTVAQQTVERLKEAVASYQSQHDSDVMLVGLAKVLAATLVLILLLVGLFKLNTRLQALARHWLTTKLESTRGAMGKIGDILLDSQVLLRVFTMISRLLTGLLALMLIHVWLLLCFDSFPYTRPWRLGILRYVLDIASGIFGAIVEAIPNLLTALVIFFLISLLVRGSNAIFRHIESGDFELSWLDRDTAPPTRRIVSLTLWLFGIVMAYPYLPGADTDAFKGMSVLVGLMISLGASSIVGQVFSGIILIYAKVFRIGEYVNVAGNEGVVSNIGMYSTRIRTLSGIEIALPHTTVLGNSIKNFSRSDMGAGPVIETTITIGYDAPWRQVHAMLLEAASKVPEILTEPKPTVLQTALSDFYVEYRLACLVKPSDAKKFPVVRSNLHASIQDTFNHYGVQIMSPHYLGDPESAKVVPPAQWAPPPAKPL